MTLANENDDGLIPRIRLIEQQPLEERAAAFALLHDELSHTLESGRPESSRPNG